MLRSVFLVSLVVSSSSILTLAQAKVTVDNSTKNPVPTVIQNTPAVKVNGTVPVVVSGTVSVNATITGNPVVSANIMGTPSVSVNNLPIETAGPGNTTAVAVKDLQNPAQQPFQTVLHCNTLPNGPTSCSVTFNVPTGKALVIEYLQFFSLESASITLNYQLQTTAGGHTLHYMFTPGGRFAADRQFSEHLVRIYADAASAITFTAFEDSSAGEIFPSVIISGHLVDVP